MNKVDGLRQSLVIRIVSAFPMRRMGRALYSEGDDDTGKRGGVVRAMHVFWEEIRIILEGNCNFAESLIGNAPNPRAKRLQFPRARLRSHLYLAESDAPYKGPCWRVIRGIGEHMNLLTAFGERG